MYDVCTVSLLLQVPGPVTCWEVGGLRGVDLRYITAVHLYTLMLPGTPMLTAGQEIGRVGYVYIFCFLMERHPFL